jgi:hypothetical protein
MSTDPSSLEFYKREGYAIFKKVYSADTIAAMKEEWRRLNAASENQDTWWFGDVVEASPTLMLPIVANPLILDFSEQIIGPYLQLDNLTLASFPIQGEKTEMGKVSGWHRDRWAQFPKGSYTKPLAFNAISYLQDMTDENGPLRLVPRSHINPTSLTDEEAKQPHPDEILVYPEAGDVFFTHNGLLHSGTLNVSSERRFFFSIFYNHAWLKHTDTFTGPNCQKIITQARANGDHRILRLLGETDRLQPRANWGILVPEEARWPVWSEEDAKEVKEPNFTYEF